MRPALRAHDQNQHAATSRVWRPGGRTETSMDDQSQALIPLRHSAAHIMASAVMELFPEAKLGFGPAIEDGFYYDFQLPRPLGPEDLPVIEARMKEIISAKFPFVHRELSIDEAR